MDVCRICLSPELHQTFSEIKCKTDKTNDSIKIFSFCLNLEPVEDKHRICIKCWKKLKTFYKFKLLALKNNDYFLYNKNDCDVSDKLKEDEVYIKSELESKIYNENKTDYIIIKSENYFDEYIVSPVIRDDEFDKSDNEPLDIIRKNSEDFLKKIERIPRKRGRPKLEKSNTVKSKLSHICAECGKEVMNLKKHMATHVSVMERKVLPCHLCSKVFATSQARRRHVKIKHLGLKKHCDICNKDIINLYIHNLSVHQSEELKHKCTLCTRRFHYVSKLQEHMRTHTDIRPYECHDCGKTFRIKLCLTTHIQNVHQKIKSHLCQICSKAFFNLSKLKQHLRTHTKEKLYPCKTCGKCFATTSQRKVHEMRHTQIKNYLCDFCDMAFITAGCRKKHMISHTKEKRYQCSYCGDRFRRSDHKKRHERTAHEKSRT